MQPFSGAWARLVQSPQAPLVTDRDPEHTTPTGAPEFVAETPDWRSTAPAPDLPDDIAGETPDAAMATGYGPVDHTPESHDFGVGIGAGLTTLESQDRMAGWHNDDRGAPAALAYHAPIMRDGTPHVDLVYDTPGAGDSPGTLELERTGVGAPSDGGNSHISKRTQRWYDRYIDMHRYPVTMRPVTPRFARPNPSVPAVPNGTQGDSPFPTAPGFWAITPDRWVVPTVRRTPEPWDQNMATDGTGQPAAGYGLSTWGL